MSKFPFLAGLLFAALVATTITASSSAAADPQRIVFPRDVSVLNAKTDLGAKGDGIADDTAALQAGLDRSCGFHNQPTTVLYLPNGTYRVTKSLVVNSAIGPWMYGETRDGVVIRLDDSSKDVTAVLRTHPRESGQNSADWFMRNLRNFTVDAGNNPETDGIRYFATNTGCLKNVRVIGNGKVGINSSFLDQSGPNLIQDCVVEGFETGILSQWIWGQTLSRVTIRNCRKVGLVVSANSVAVEDLVVSDTPQAVHVIEPNGWGHWSGVLALVGGTFTGGNADQPAIKNDGVLFARNVKTKGFRRAIESSADAGISPSGADIEEYLSHPVKELFEQAKSIPQLEIRPEPAFAWETETSRWLCANDHGATSNDGTDDTAAIQAAIDEAARSGKTVVYFRGCGGHDPNWFNVDGEIKVHGSVRYVLGLGWARILGGKDGKFVVDEQSAAEVKFQNIDSFGGPPVWLENRSAKKKMIVESCGVRILGTGTGDIFLTDCPCGIDLRKAGQKVWCRHINPEGHGDQALVSNSGADLWILGMKFEGTGVRVKTENGGRTEAFGIFNYGPGIPEGDLRPMFEVIDGSFAVYGLRELSFGGNCYRVKVREQRGKEIRTLGDDKEPGWIGWAAYRGWSGK